MKLFEEPLSLNDSIVGKVDGRETRLRHALHRLHRNMLTSSPATGVDFASSVTNEDSGSSGSQSSSATSSSMILNGMESTGSLVNATPTPGQSLEVDDDTRKLYLYGAPPLILFCIVSVAINVNILISVYWIRRPLSPTLHISLSLAGADAFSSIALGVGLVMNSFLPVGLGYQLQGVDCFLLGLEAVRLAAVIVTVAHLMALAANHYLGILRPLHYLSIMTHRNTTLLASLLWILPLAFFFSYFALVENQGFQSNMCSINTFLFRERFRLMFSSLFFGPFLVMVCIYAHIFIIVKRHQASRMRFSRAGSTHGGPNNLQQNASQQMAKNVKAIRTTLYILGSYVVGWMPGTILYTLVCQDCLLNFDWLTGKGRFLVFNAVNCLIILKTLVNPIIYAARMHEIKVAKRRMYAALCKCFDARGDGLGIGLQSSEGNQSTRVSVSKMGVSRLGSNVSVRLPRTNEHPYARTSTVL